jgi:hypothetical protein
MCENTLQNTILTNNFHFLYAIREYKPLFQDYQFEKDDVDVYIDEINQTKSTNCDEYVQVLCSQCFNFLSISSHYLIVIVPQH